MLTQADIAALIPHQGGMCLLDRVVRWDAAGILCTAVSHRDPGNPLRRDGRLAAICGIEYGLQAMAVHGALVDRTPQPPGFVGSLRDVSVRVPALDAAAAPLDVAAEVLFRDTHGFIYRFTVATAGEVLLSGQAAIIIPTGASAA